MASGDGVRRGGGRVAWGLGGSRRREGEKEDLICLAEDRAGARVMISRRLCDFCSLWQAHVDGGLFARLGVDLRRDWFYVRKSMG